jgi:hypothetical protein
MEKADCEALRRDIKAIADGMGAARPGTARNVAEAVLATVPAHRRRNRR